MAADREEMQAMDRENDEALNKRDKRIKKLEGDIATYQCVCVCVCVCVCACVCVDVGVCGCVGVWCVGVCVGCVCMLV